MNLGKEFRKYAVKHQNIGGVHVDRYMNAALMTPSNFTPYIIEERPMNATALDVFSRLMMDRIIFFGVPVTDSVANIVQAQLLFLESTDPNRDIQMYINSPGGSVIAGMGIYDVMQYVVPDVATICTGLAASMGAVLLTAGAEGKRSCLKHGRVMIHQILGGAQGQFTDIEISYKLMKKLKEELNTILAKHTGQEYAKIEADCERDNWMTAHEAKDYGLVDEVLERNLAAEE